MNREHDDPNEGDEHFTDSSMISTCCGASAWGEIDEYQCGICSACHDHASFERGEE